MSDSAEVSKTTNDDDGNAIFGDYVCTTIEKNLDDENCNPLPGPLDGEPQVEEEFTISLKDGINRTETIKIVISDLE